MHRTKFLNGNFADFKGFEPLKKGIRGVLCLKKTDKLTKQNHL